MKLFIIYASYKMSAYAIGRSYKIDPAQCIFISWVNTHIDEDKQLRGIHRESLLKLFAIHNREPANYEKVLEQSIAKHLNSNVMSEKRFDEYIKIYNKIVGK